MRARIPPLQLARCRTGATATEFALVLPLLLLFLFGIIDAGRMLWTWNRAEKATHMGVRYAVSTDMVPKDLATRDFALNNGVASGEPVPTSVFASTTCRVGSCTGGWGHDAASFRRIVDRMALFMPEIQPANVLIDYENVGLGFAGDPNGPDVSPLVRVRLQNLSFQPLLLTLFGASITLPDFSAALTQEDGSGTVSN